MASGGVGENGLYVFSTAILLIFTFHWLLAIMSECQPKLPKPLSSKRFPRMRMGVGFGMATEINLDMGSHL
jgi:hypothetical protein